MAKKSCVICGKELGLFSAKATISDGVVCADCLHQAGIGSLSNGQSFDTTSLKQLIGERIILVRSFSPTKKIGNYLAIDEAHKSFKIGKDIFEYSNLLSFELMEDGHTVTKGGLGSAIAGGILFGGIGAVVGGVVGGKKTKGVCNSMQLKITLRNSYTDTVYIPFITTSTKTSGFIYKTAQSSAQSCISALEIIADEANSMAGSTSQAFASSAADEIMKFKQLLDAGIITQEEFDTKKQQLLNS